MKWERVFLENGRVRPIWRFFVSLVIIVFVHLAAGVLLGIIFAAFSIQPVHVLLWANSLVLLILLAIFKILTGLFEEKPLGSIGLAFYRRWKTEMGMGLLLGSVMILTVTAVEWVLRFAHFGWNLISVEQMIASGAYYALLFAVAATNEEIIFRGYAFQRLVEAAGPVAAVAILSISFGLVHLSNPSHTWLSTLNTILIGIPFAVAYLRTRSLWLPIGMHFSWNFVQGYGLGLPVSGILFSNSLLKADVHGLTGLTGGNYGPEGSWITTGIILVATIYLLFSRSIYITEEMRELALSGAKLPHGNLTHGMGSTIASADSTNMSIPGPM